ncbi:MAG: potassium transporter Kup [Thermodesulfovibrionia bacterium]
MLKGIIKSLGLVFGDIGTSPIYTLTVIFILTKPTPENVMGILSLIVWTLIILVTVEYAWLAMSLGKRGEGGTIVLKELLVPLLRSGRQVAFVTLLSFIGISLLIGDGVITPAISIMSAVEGMLLIPGFEDTHQNILILIAVVIATLLFLFQKKGAGRVASAFGPLMLIWFIALTAFGLISLSHLPSVIQSINPYHAIRFLYDNGATGFLVLSEVILCATGGEALYADMGHLGRRPIVNAWAYLVFPALLINYLGQGAHLILHPETKMVLFGMVFYYAEPIYIPFLILSIIATIIASQAMISGVFSVVYQGINTRIMPLFKIDYTSPDLRSQIYIGSVNWFLLIAVLFIMLQFRESSRLAAAYGLAVNIVMCITAILMTMIFLIRGAIPKFMVATFLIIVTLVFLGSNTSKIPHGGYWSLIIALIPFLTIMVYTNGQERLYRMMRFMPLEDFLNKFTKAYPPHEKIKGTALFLIRDVNEIPFYIIQTMFYHGIIYEDNIFVSIIKRDDPFGVTGYFKEDIANGLRHFEIQYGYMEVVDVEELLREAGIEEKTIFYGIEDITTRSPIWKAFSIIKKITPPFVQFYKLPSRKLHGVVTRVEM